MWSNVINKAGETNKKRYRVDSEAFWNKAVGGGINMEHKKLSVGEKYLSVRINIGGQNFNFAAFKNTDKKGQEPDYKGQNIGVWITTKKAKTEGEHEEGI